MENADPLPVGADDDDFVAGVPVDVGDDELVALLQIPAAGAAAAGVVDPVVRDPAGAEAAAVLAEDADPLAVAAHDDQLVAVVAVDVGDEEPVRLVEVPAARAATAGVVDPVVLDPAGAEAAVVFAQDADPFAVGADDDQLVAVVRVDVRDEEPVALLQVPAAGAAAAGVVDPVVLDPGSGKPASRLAQDADPLAVRADDDQFLAVVAVDVGDEEAIPQLEVPAAGAAAAGRIHPVANEPPGREPVAALVEDADPLSVRTDDHDLVAAVVVDVGRVEGVAGAQVPAFARCAAEAKRDVPGSDRRAGHAGDDRVQRPVRAAVGRDVDRRVRAPERVGCERRDRDLARTCRVDGDVRLAVLARLVALSLRNDVDDADHVPSGSCPMRKSTRSASSSGWKSSGSSAV